MERSVQSIVGVGNPCKLAIWMRMFFFPSYASDFGWVCVRISEQDTMKRCWVVFSCVMFYCETRKQVCTAWLQFHN